VPMVIRLQQGAVGGWGAQHSQSLEAWFQHVPGLKMVAPSMRATLWVCFARRYAQ